MHAVQIMNPFNATNQNIIPLKIIGVTSYIDVREPTLDDDEDQDSLKIELMVETLL